MHNHRVFPFLNAIQIAFFFSFIFLAWAQSTPVHWLLMDQQRLPAEEVTTMAQDDIGNRYFGTKKGLSQVTKSGSFQIFTRESSKGKLGSDSVTCLAVDPYRGLWVGTDGGGLSVYVNGSWSRYTKASTGGGLPDDGVLAMAIRKEEHWIATRNGFAVLRGGVWTPFTGDLISGRLPNRVATSIAADSTGNIWIGTIGGLVMMSGSRWNLWTQANTQGGLPHNGITSLLVDKKGSLWVGTQTGLVQREVTGKWISHQKHAELGDLEKEVTYSISMSYNGDVWACLKGGAARYSNQRWEVFSKNNTTGLLTRFIYFVLPSTGQDIWFATGKGVAIMTPANNED